MSNWILNGSEIPAPHKKEIGDDVLAITHKTLSGSNTRDFIGTGKKIIMAQYSPISSDDFSVIKTAYELQRDSGVSINLTVGDFSFNANVHIILDIQGYPYPNNYSYIDVKVTFLEV